MRPVITVENLGKSYLLHHRRQERFPTLRDAISGGVRQLGRTMLRHSPGPEREEFWALKEVSFDVQQGDRLGIIGRNGAGKSTLLKILSRITEPTCGKVSLKGRVASLLEVGTGFHPELTGRENIFLNGAILGMKRAEIRRKFDEIVAFAEVEKFLDTPVKRYSSGMYVRLAFAVAAHLEPEILIVDEVLAVGDAQFQKKCLGKMEEVGREGRTVLFVSHSMAAVQSLCAKGLLISAGRVVAAGAANDVIASYVGSCQVDSDGSLPANIDRSGDGNIRFHGIRMFDAAGDPVDKTEIGKRCTVCLDYTCADVAAANNIEIGIAIKSLAGINVAMVSNVVSNFQINNLSNKGKIYCTFRNFPFASGDYYLSVSISSSGKLNDWIDRAMKFSVIDYDYYGSGRLYVPGSTMIYLDNEWRCVDE